MKCAELMIDAREVHVSCCVNVEGVQMGGKVGYVLKMGIVRSGHVETERVGSDRYSCRGMVMWIDAVSGAVLGADRWWRYAYGGFSCPPKIIPPPTAIRW